MRQWRWYSKLLFALLVAAFAYFVWPTPWMYFGNGMGGQVGTIVRVNRITGTPYMLHGQDGWQKIRAKRTFGELAPEPKGRTLGEKWSQGRRTAKIWNPSAISTRFWLRCERRKVGGPSRRSWPGFGLNRWRAPGNRLTHPFV